MDVKIGVMHTGREINIESEDSPEQVESAVTQAVAAGTPVRLVDRKGRVFLVPAAVVGYVEIGSERKGGVGFGAL